MKYSCILRMPHELILKVKICYRLSVMYCICAYYNDVLCMCVENIFVTLMYSFFIHIKFTKL